MHVFGVRLYNEFGVLLRFCSPVDFTVLRDIGPW